MMNPAAPNYASLKEKFWTAWKYVIERYKNTPGIAAWEVLSEPRDQSLTAQQVNAFYKEGIE